MITPTVGRVVWFYKYNGQGDYKGPLAAIVTAVWNNTCVNLCVFTQGTPASETRVYLRQPDAEQPPQNYCEWMPYQVGQAAKTQELQEALAKL